MSGSRRSPGKRAKDGSPAFENVKNQMAYCGLWCGSCLVGNGELNELVVKCRRALADYSVDEWGPKDVEYGNLLKWLDAIGSMEPCPGCLKGGGRTDCEIRACATEKGLAECVDCDTHGACRNSAILGHMRSGALRVGMKVKDKRGSRAAALRGWMAEIEDE